MTPQVRFATAGVVALALFVVTYLAFVTTETGQRIENLALRGAELRDLAERQVAEDVLSLVTLALFVFAVTGVLVTGFVFRRPGLGSAAAAIMVLSLGAAELFKEWIERPELRSGPTWILRNSFPSGTATAATAMAVGAFLVSPNRLRWLVLPPGALFAALVGHSVQTTGWHRLSDTIAAPMLVIGIACIGVALLARAGMVQRSDGGLIDRRVSHVLLVGSAGVLLVAITLLAMPTAFPLLTSPDGARRAFLQTAFPLVGVSVTVFLLTAFGLLVQPFALGAGSRGSDDPAWRSRPERRVVKEVHGVGAVASAGATDSDDPSAVMSRDQPPVVRRDT